MTFDPRASAFDRPPHGGGTWVRVIVGYVQLIEGGRWYAKYQWVRA